MSERLSERQQWIDAVVRGLGGEDDSWNTPEELTAVLVALRVERDVAIALARTTADRARIAEEATAPLRAEIERHLAAGDEWRAEWREGRRAAEAERDTLAAALAEVREAYRPLAGWTRPDGVYEIHETQAARERAQAALAALPADLAAEHDRRVRAEALEAAKGLAYSDAMEAWDAVVGDSLGERDGEMVRGLFKCAVRALMCPEHDTNEPIIIKGTLAARAADERGGR